MMAEPRVERNVRRMIDQDAPEADIDAYLASEGLTAEQFRGGVPAAQPAGTLENIAAGAAQGVVEVGAGPAQAADYLASKALGFSPFERIVGEAPIEAQRRGTEAFEQRYGDSVAATAGRVGGNIAATLPVAAIGRTGALGRALASPSTATRAAAGGALAAGEGALIGGLVSEGGLEERAKGAALGAAVAAPLGAAAPAVGNVLKRAGRRAATSKAVKALVKEAPSVEELRKASTALFKRAEAAGVVVKPKAFADKVDDLSARMIREGIDPTLHPKATAALKRLQDEIAGPVSLEKLQTLRRVVGTAAKSLEPDEKRLASEMIDTLDDFVSTLKPADLAAGELRTATKDLMQARKLWGRMRRAQIVEDIFEEAQEAASGFENGLRIGFRKLLKSRKQIRGFSPGEKDAMRKVVRGTATSNTLKKLSRLSFGMGQQSGFLGGSIGAGTGGAIGSAVAGWPGAAIGAAVPPAIGRTAQKGAAAATRRQADIVRAMAASGGAPAVPAIQSGPIPLELLLQRNALLTAPIAQRVTQP